MCVICELTELKNLKPKKNQWPHGMTICKICPVSFLENIKGFAD